MTMVPLNKKTQRQLSLSGYNLQFRTLVLNRLFWQAIEITQRYVTIHRASLGQTSGFRNCIFSFAATECFRQRLLGHSCSAQKYLIKNLYFDFIYIVKLWVWPLFTVCIVYSFCWLEYSCSAVLNTLTDVIVWFGYMNNWHIYHYCCRTMRPQGNWRGLLLEVML